MKESRFNYVSLYVLTCLIWGGTWLAIKISLEGLTPFISAGFRFIAATIFLSIIIYIKKIPVERSKPALKLYSIMGFFSFAIPFGLVYWGEQHIPSGLASVLFAVYPFFVALFSFIFLKSEEIDLFKVLGMIFGFGGIVVIFSDSFGGDLNAYLLGMLAVTGSGIMQAFVAVLVKKNGAKIHPIALNYYPMGIAGVFMFFAGLIFEDYTKIHFNNEIVLSVLYLAFFGSVVSFSSYYWLLKRINIVLLSLVAFITPIIALIAGWIFYGEELSGRHLAGSLFVLAGVLVANLGGLLRSRFKKA